MKGKGQISFFAAVLISINVIVGGGIYFGPQVMADKAGNFSFLAWIFAAILLAPVIWSIAVASRLFPGEGGFYNYCKNGINDVTGFIALFAYFLGYAATGATLVRILKDHILGTMGQGFFGSFLGNLAIIAVVCFLNLLSIKAISKVQSIGTIIKLIPILFIIFIFAFYWDSSVINLPLSGMRDVGAALPFAIFGYWGAETCCSIGHYLKGGPSKVFGVILTAFLTTAFLYMMFHFGLLHLMGAENLAQLGVAGFPQFLNIKSSFFGGLVGWMFTIMLGLTFFNTVYGICLLAIDNIVCMAKNKMVYYSSDLQKVNKFDRPVIAIFTLGGVVLFLVTFIGNPAILASLSNLGVLTALLLTVFAVANTQIKKKAGSTLIITLLGIPSCLLLFYYSWMQAGPETVSRLINTSPLFAGIGLGLVMYHANKKKNR